jgi:hypothetical protein
MPSALVRLSRTRASKVSVTDEVMVFYPPFHTTEW